MNIILTGSLGNISKPLAEKLIEKKHAITVISSNAERQKDIEAIGAKAAIGSMTDVDFLSKTFAGADIVYVMEALKHDAFFDPNIDIVEAITQIGANYKEAIERSGVKQIIHLSSIGAHTNEGNGMLRFHYNVEQILNQLPDSVAIKFIRPAGFYYNLLSFIPSIKALNIIAQNYAGDDKKPWVSPFDIAEVIAEEMELPFLGRQIRYVASDEISPNEIAKTLGEAIGKPDLKWIKISDEDLLNGLISAGFNPQTAKGIVDMNIAIGNGYLSQDYNQNRPTLGKIKLKDFAHDFAAIYHQS